MSNGIYTYEEQLIDAVQMADSIGIYPISILEYTTAHNSDARRILLAMYTLYLLDLI